MSSLGTRHLQNAQWLLGFDFDGTLADLTDGHSVPQEFFRTINTLNSHTPTAWGICTGRSLDFLIEGMENAQFPYWPDFVVSQERDLFYLDQNEAHYSADEERNALASSALENLMERNQVTINKAKAFVQNETKGQWVSVPGDPAGVIATHEDEISALTEVYDTCPHKSPDLEYQRNSIYLRFSHRDYCKGTAIQYLQDRYSIPHSQTLVMGDNFNDLSMLNAKVAQHYGGPANSIERLKTELKSNGGFVTKASYAHGVIEAINEIVPGS